MVQSNQLKNLSLFNGCSPSSLEQLSKDMQEKTFETGDLIIKDKEVSGALYFVVKGSVAITKSDKVVARLGAGEFFGEMSFLENQPHSADVIAHEKSLIYVLPRTSLDGLFKKDPQSALNNVLTLFGGVSTRLRQTTQELVKVFEISRIIGRSNSAKDLMRDVLDQVLTAIEGECSVTFYRWNLFNDEYDKVISKGPLAGKFPGLIDKKSPLVSQCPWGSQIVADASLLSISKGALIVSRSDMDKSQEGLFLYVGPDGKKFTSGERQLMETVSAMLAPALATVRGREEEMSRKRLEQGRQRGYSI